MGPLCHLLPQTAAPAHTCRLLSRGSGCSWEVTRQGGGTGAWLHRRTDLSFLICKVGRIRAPLGQHRGVVRRWPWKGPGGFWWLGGGRQGPGCAQVKGRKRGIPLEKGGGRLSAEPSHVSPGRGWDRTAGAPEGGGGDPGLFSPLLVPRSVGASPPQSSLLSLFLLLPVLEKVRFSEGRAKSSSILPGTSQALASLSLAICTMGTSSSEVL